MIAGKSKIVHSVIFFNSLSQKKLGGGGGGGGELKCLGWGGGGEASPVPPIDETLCGDKVSRTMGTAQAVKWKAMNTKSFIRLPPGG